MGKASDKLSRELKKWKIAYGKDKTKFKKDYVCVAERDHWYRLYNILYPALNDASRSLPTSFSFPSFGQLFAALSHLEMLEAVFPKKHKKREKLDSRRYTKDEQESMEQRFDEVKKPFDLLSQLMAIGAGGDKAFKYPSASFTAFLFECLESIASGLVDTGKLKGDSLDVVKTAEVFLSSHQEAGPLLEKFYEKARHTSCKRRGNDFEYVI